MAAGERRAAEIGLELAEHDVEDAAAAAAEEFTNPDAAADSDITSIEDAIAFRPAHASVYIQLQSVSWFNVARTHNSDGVHRWMQSPTI